MRVYLVYGAGESLNVGNLVIKRRYLVYLVTTEVHWAISLQNNQRLSGCA